MKHIKNVLITLFCVVAFSTLSHAEKVVVATNDWAPYNSVDGTGLVDIVVKEALALVGHEVEYAVQPWKRAYVSVKDGKADITYPWSFNEQRNSEITYNASPLIVNQSIFWYLKGKEFSWQDFPDLNKYSIGGMIGYSDTDLLESKGIKVNTVKDELTNLKKLLSGRIDAFSMNTVVGNQIIKDNLSAEEQGKLATFPDKPLVETNMHAVFSPNARGKKLAEDFEKGLQMLRESGRYDEILF